MDLEEAGIDPQQLAQQVRVSERAVREVAARLSQGATVAYIARYCREETGNLSEYQIARICEQFERMRALEARRKALLLLLNSHDHNVAELERQIRSARTRHHLDELHWLLKRQRPARSIVERNLALEPLVSEILGSALESQQLQERVERIAVENERFSSVEEVQQTIKEMLVERIVHRSDVRRRLRAIVYETGYLESRRLAVQPGSAGEACKAAGDPPADGSPPGTAAPVEGGAPTALGGASAAEERRERRRLARRKRRAQLEAAFQPYFDASKPISKLNPWYFLELDRGERLHVLRLSLRCDTQQLVRECTSLVVTESHRQAELLSECASDAVIRRFLPEFERGIRRELVDRAEEQKEGTAARVLRSLLLQRPVHGNVLALYASFNGQCHVAALDERGNPVAMMVGEAASDEERRSKMGHALGDIIAQHHISLIAIGDGPRTRGVEQLVWSLFDDSLSGQNLHVAMVSTDGLAAYATSTLAMEELPGYDPQMRTAIAVGRRLLDPLDEFTKIDPLSLQLGIHEREVASKRAAERLGEVIRSVVNLVGVDANRAGIHLLRYVSGLNPLVARRLVDHRSAHGPFSSREALRQVEGFDDLTFQQAAGFLRVVGDNPLDATTVHPNDYAIARQVLERCRVGADELARHLTALSAAGAAPAGELSAADAEPWAGRFRDCESLAADLKIHPFRLRGVLNALRDAGLDPRRHSLLPILRNRRIAWNGLQPETLLAGKVLNVLDFGAFVDLGMGVTGLVHISRLADRFVHDAREIACPGEIIPVWIVSVDTDRHRVALSAVPPGAGRKPKGQGRREQRGVPRSGAAPSGRGQERTRRPAHPATPLVPLTDAMKQGREPMRTFSDLKQFYDLKSTTPDDSTDSSPAEEETGR
jgi:uncharacterized protein